MTARSALFLVVAAMGLSCTLGAPMDGLKVPCTSDEQCGGDQICFPDGCGDPGKDIAVEVVPGANSGQLAQDFKVDKVLPTLNFEAFAPPVIQGELTQESALGGGTLPYNTEVSVRATGESLIIPGRTRSFQYTVVPDRGAYQVPVAAGMYTVSFTPTDLLMPPKILSSQDVRPGEVHELNSTFPAVTSLLRIDGRLLDTLASGLPVQSTPMEIQAFDPWTRQALSQRAKVSSGSSTSTGDFFLYVEQGLGLSEIHLRATPKDSAAMVPAKTFLVPLNAKLAEPLELGEYGAPVTVHGRVVDSKGQPVVGATVYLEGTVGGGGTFRSAAAGTDENGAFSLKTLPSAPNGALTFYAVPPNKAAAGLLQKELEIPAAGGELGDLLAPDKIQVTGKLMRPDGAPATSVIIRAEPVAVLETYPLPIGTTEGATDEAGGFTLQLSPAVYRLDFVPFDEYPRVSRFVTVRPIPTRTGDGSEPILLPEFMLSRGRTVNGTISSIPKQLSTTQTPQPAPGASVKFFRIVSFEGQTSSVLLAEGMADTNGAYTVVLPTR